MEEAYRHEKETKQEIEQAIQLYSFHDLQDALDADDKPDENRLLPAMNKIWPNLVNCIKNRNPLVRVAYFIIFQVGFDLCIR